MPLLSPTARRWSPAAAGVVVVGLAFAVPLHGGASRSETPRSTAATTTTATTSTTTTATAAPAPTGIPAVTGQQAPAAGQAHLVAGPFTDRLRLVRLAVVKGTGVAGEFAQRFDNSALLDLELQADFYAADGTLLGTKRRVLRQPDVIAAGKGGTGDQRFGGNIVFTVDAPAAYAARVAAALVSVPVLVNE